MLPGDAQERIEGWVPEEHGSASVLPVYENPTLEGVESTWGALDSFEDDLYRRRGALADAVSREAIYGEASLKTFAGRMNVAASTAHDYLATYRRLARLPELVLSRVLALNARYGHYRAVSGVKDHTLYESLLIRTSDEGWSVGRLAEAVHASKLGSAPDSVPAAADTLSSDVSAEENARIGEDFDGSITEGWTEIEGWSEGEEPPYQAPTHRASVTDIRAHRDRVLLEGFLELCEMEGYELTRIDTETGEVTILSSMSEERGSLIERYVGASVSPNTSEAVYAKEGLR